MKILKYITRSVITLIFLVSIAGCGSSGNTSAIPTPSAQTSSATASASLESGKTVVLKGFAFTPAEITVSKGDTVTWTNEDSATHDVAGDAFKSGDMKKGDTFSYTFNETGTFDYICSFHPSMKGTVIVQ